ncbi:adenine methyltransferase [Akkermansia muciniphila]|nr:adenine methyltransferase [Akkermansia muciniphila]PNC58351.1 adenine methyltransferase [Akkermansia muciniphila]
MGPWKRRVFETPLWGKKRSLCSRLSVLGAEKGGGMNTFNTAKTEKTTNVWLTPRYVLDLLGHFDVDPCAATVRPWDCASVNYTEADNGLLMPWEGRVWLNPPYGNEAEAFMERMSNHVGGGLALIFMRSDTRWFQRCVLSRARYLFLWRGRIRFCRPDGETPGNQPNAPSCLVAWDNTEAPLLYTLQNQGHGKVAVL